MKNLLKRFLRDDAGFVISSELVLVATILVIGMIAGLNTVKDSVVQELGDLSASIGSVSQSYTYNGITGHSSATAGSAYVDQIDFCDEPWIRPTRTSMFGHRRRVLLLLPLVIFRQLLWTKFKFVGNCVSICPAVLCTGLQAD